MKKLFIILSFASIGCNAQNMSEPTFYPSYAKEQKTNDTIYNVTVFGEKYIKLSCFQEYQKECYNDSSFVEVQIKPSGWCNSHVGGMSTAMHCPAVYEQKWVHRTPTFEGFLIFINKRYGK